MKKTFGLLVVILTLAACQGPINRDVYRATGPRVCYEYYDSFRCSAPQQVWNETIYPKNESQMGIAAPLYVPYHSMNLSRAVYGTM